MRRLVAALALLLGAFGVYALVRTKGGDPSPPRPPSVLLVTIDTMRADAVGPDQGTPAMAAFLAEATRFRGARTVVPLTLPTLVSIFSGLLPARHGVHDNSSVLIPSQRDFPLLAEEYSAAGYATAGFTPVSLTGPHSSIDSGFGRYDAELGGVASVAPYMQAERRVEAPLEWLRARDASRPWFCWVHFYDPHSPYLPFGGDDRRAGTRAGDPPEAIYRGEIRRVDAAVERLLAAVADDAIVILVSDHGESLGEHGEPMHGWFCYGATCDVFLAVRAPGLARGAVDDAPRSVCDIAPTLRAWCGLAPRPSHGTRLLDPAKPAVVTEAIHLWRTHGYGQCFASSDGRFTLVERGPSLELYDRAADPGETRPLPWEGHEAYERLDRALEEVRSLGARGSEAEYVPSVQTPYSIATRAVSNLLPRKENGRLVDPGTKADFYEALRMLSERGQAAFQARRRDALAAVVNELQALLPEAAGSPAPSYQLAECFRALASLTGQRQWSRDAARAGREAMRLGYLASPVLQLVCGASRAGGDVGDCREALQLAENTRIVPDLDCLAEVVELTRFLAASGDAEAVPRAVAVLSRARGLHAGATDRARIDDWTRSLQSP